VDERPPKLPFAATRVLKASGLLSPGAKLVWLEDSALDQGPEGAWISATHLAQRLGLSKDAVERYRRGLHTLGVYHVIRRQGARSDGWRPTLPPECLPPLRPTPDQVLACAARLDAWLRTNPMYGVTTGATVAQFPRPGGADSAPLVAQQSAPQPEAREEGGREEVLSDLLVRSEATLQPQAQKQAGVASPTPEGRMEKAGSVLARVVPNLTGGAHVRAHWRNE
jgi:hypothetical protein